MSAFSSATGSAAQRSLNFAYSATLSAHFTEQPNTRVEVTGINGSVSAETASGNTAEIYVVRSARTKEALTHRRVFIEEGAGYLKIRGEEEHGRQPEVRQRVVLKLPRSIDYVAELPRDPNGKLYKRRLRDPYWADRTRAI